MTTLTKIRKLRREANKIIKTITNANKAWTPGSGMDKPSNTSYYRNRLGRDIAKFSRKMRMGMMPK